MKSPVGHRLSSRYFLRSPSRFGDKFRRVAAIKGSCNRRFERVSTYLYFSHCPREIPSENVRCSFKSKLLFHNLSIHQKIFESNLRKKDAKRKVRENIHLSEIMKVTKDLFHERCKAPHLMIEQYRAKQYSPCTKGLGPDVVSRIEGFLLMTNSCANYLLCNSAQFVVATAFFI